MALETLRARFKILDAVVLRALPSNKGALVPERSGEVCLSMYILVGQKFPVLLLVCSALESRPCSTTPEWVSPDDRVCDDVVGIL